MNRLTLIFLVTFPLTAILRSLLTQCALGKGPDDFLITRADGAPIKDFRKRWANLFAAAAVNRASVHDLRRTAARDMRRARVPESVIMKIGGWKTRAGFERYNIVNGRDMKEALGARERAHMQPREDEAQQPTPVEAPAAVLRSRPN